MSGQFCRCAAIGSALIATTWIIEPARAEPSSAAAEVASLLEKGWQSSASALTAAEEHYQTALQLAPADRRADFAMALVHLRRNRYDEAKQLLSTALAKDVANLSAWRAQFWLLFLKGEYDAALARMKMLADLYPPGMAAAPEVDEQLMETAVMMGRLCGYLAGPKQSAFPEAQLTAAEEKIRGRLSTERRAAFDEARQGVLDRHKQLVAELEQNRQQDLADQQKSKIEDQQFVDSERQRIASETSRLEQEAAGAKTTADNDVSDLDKQIIPLQTRYNQLQAVALPIQQRIAVLQGNLAAAVAATQDKDKYRAAAAQADVNRFSQLLAFEDARLAPIQLEAARVQAQGVALQQRRAAVLAQLQATLSRIDGQLRKMGSTLKALDGKERRLETAPDQFTARTQGTANLLSALVTYHRYPLDEEQQRLLKALGR